VKLLKLFFVIYFAFVLFVIPCFSQNRAEDADADAVASLRRERERTLAFGLHSEISSLIREFIADRDISYNNQLLALFENTRNAQIQRDIIELYTAARSDNLMSRVITLIENREYENRSVIVAGIRYVSEMQGVEANEKLFLELLEDNQRDFRIEAIRALAATGNKRFSQPLMQIYETDDDSAVRLQVLLHIGKLEDPATAQFLRDIITDQDIDRTSRQFAINSLGYIRDADSFDVLVAVYGEDDPLIRIYALAAIAKYDRKEADTIIFEAMRDEVWRIRSTAVTEAGRRRNKDFIQILIYRADRDPVDSIRIAALDSLAEIGGKEAFDYIRSRALDPRTNPGMRRHAFSLAVNRDTTNSIKMIETIFENEPTAANRAFIESLAAELCNVEYPGLAPFFERMLASGSVVIRVAGLRGIRLNRISSLKDKVRAIAEDERQARSVRNHALATLEVL